jgi:hypothetical protein
MCDGAQPAWAGFAVVASSGGPGWAPSAPEGAPEVCGVLVQCPPAGAEGLWGKA